MVAYRQRLFVCRGGGRFTDRRCRGAASPTPRGGERRREVHGRDKSLPYGWNVSGRWPGSGGAKDKRAAMARLRAGHARPLRTATNGLRTRGAREGGSPPPFAVGGWLPGNGRPRKARQSPSGLAGSASSPVRGAFCAGEARERSLPIRGGGREAGRRGSRACGWLPVNGLLR